MKFFVDTAEVSEIEELAATGLLDGVTTNPSLIAKSGRPMLEVVREICALVDGPVSAEVTAIEADAMLAEGRRLADLAPNVCVKLPLTWDGLKACRQLTRENIQVNVTLCFSPVQALLAAKAGATFISPFVGRLDDIGHDGMQLIADICDIYAQYPMLETEVLVASVRHPVHLLQAAKLGADVATLPPAVLKKLVEHPLTD
ncbi:MAG: fructose-6-phosphate aldolase, partial [Pseudomonadota bacterium]